MDNHYMYVLHVDRRSDGQALCPPRYCPASTEYGAQFQYQIKVHFAYSEEVLRCDPLPQSGYKVTGADTSYRDRCLCDFAGTLVPVPKSTECYWDVNLILFELQAKTWGTIAASSTWLPHYYWLSLFCLLRYRFDSNSKLNCILFYFLTGQIQLSKVIKIIFKAPFVRTGHKLTWGPCCENKSHVAVCLSWFVFLSC